MPRMVETSDPKRLRTREYNAQYMRKYRAAHPEKALGWRIRDAVNLLTSHGYTVSSPAEEQKGGETDD